MSTEKKEKKKRQDVRRKRATKPGCAEEVEELVVEVWGEPRGASLRPCARTQGGTLTHAQRRYKRWRGEECDRERDNLNDLR